MCKMQAATLQEMQQKLNAVHFEVANLHGGMSAISMRTEEATGQGQQLIAMVAALQHTALVGGMERMQITRTEDHQLPLHVGVAQPHSKAEGARQRQQMRWNAQRQAQHSTAMTTQPTGMLLPAAAQSMSASGTVSSTAQATASRSHVTTVSADLVLHPWQDWQGDIKSITSAFSLVPLFYLVAFQYEL